jgi:hypothetical protein
VPVSDILLSVKHLTYREIPNVYDRRLEMDKIEWLVQARDAAQIKSQDSYGKLLEMMKHLEEDVDPRLTPEQTEFFKSLITGLIDTIRSFKYEKRH